MAPVSFSFVVRFSSEDAIFKAANLCQGKADATGTWKCAKEDTNCGRMEAEFQLEKASYISHIDIGNCGSAFIEIFVGSSMWPQDKDFITLLPSAMLMNPAECKHWIKTHTVRMFNQNAFSKQALGSQWDRVRVVCRQPYRKDKQFGLSFIRVRSIPDDDDTPSSPGDVPGKTATSTSGQPSDEENDEDGVMRLKKASGLMGCLRSFEKGSPESALNRAGKMLQAALDSRSPTTPGNKSRNKRSSSQSSSEISSSPESPYRKRNSQSSSEGPKEKKNKPERKWSLAGDIQDEVALFLEDIDFTKIDLEIVTFKDLRSQMEAQRGCTLTKHEKKVFLQMTKAAIEKAMPPVDDSDDQEDVLELSINEHDVIPTVEKTKEPNKTRKSAKESSKTSHSEEKVPSSKTKSPPLPSTSTVSTPQSRRRKRSPINLDEDIFKVDIPSALIPIEDDTEELPSMLYSSENDIPARQEFCYTTGDYQPSPIKKKISEPMVECPICSSFFPASDVEFHAALCTNETGPTPSVAPPEEDLMPCPICSKLFPLAQIEQHADVCVETSICEGSNNLGREAITI
ncbi:uncharacterized protein LOC144645329 isoform X2 [Oculina patagonica]